MQRDMLAPDGVDFGDLPSGVNALLQRGVAAHRTDKFAADALFREALALDPAARPTYFCLYKIHCYGGRLTEARGIAQTGLKVAAGQAGWSSDWREWPETDDMTDGPGRFAPYTLKALAFTALKDGREADAGAKPAALGRLAPSGSVGWHVIVDMAHAISA